MNYKGHRTRNHQLDIHAARRLAIKLYMFIASDFVKSATPSPPQMLGAG